MIPQVTSPTDSYIPLPQHSISLTPFYDKALRVKNFFLNNALPVISQNSLFTSMVIVFVASKVINTVNGEEPEYTTETPPDWKPFMDCLFDCFAERCTILSKDPYIMNSNCEPYQSLCENQCISYLEELNITYINGLTM